MKQTTQVINRIEYEIIVIESKADLTDEIMDDNTFNYYRKDDFELLGSTYEIAKNLADNILAIMTRRSNES